MSKAGAGAAVLAGAALVFGIGMGVASLLTGEGEDKAKGRRGPREGDGKRREASISGGGGPVRGRDDDSPEEEAPSPPRGAAAGGGAGAASGGSGGSGAESGGARDPRIEAALRLRAGAEDWLTWVQDVASAAASKVMEVADDAIAGAGAGSGRGRGRGVVTVGGGGGAAGGPLHDPPDADYHRVLWLQASNGCLAGTTLDDLLAIYESLAPVDPPEEAASAIDRDIRRTFPHQARFTESGPGRAQLRRVLRAYAAHDTTVGYVQGMNFLAGFLLLHTRENEGEAFALLVRLLQARRFGMRDLYLPGLPGVRVANRQIEILLREYQPRVAAHLSDVGFSFMFVMEWYYTLFSYMLPVPVVTLLWDEVFEHGWTAVLRTVLVLFEVAEPALLPDPRARPPRTAPRDLPSTIHLLKSFRMSSGNTMDGETSGDAAGGGDGSGDVMELDLVVPVDFIERVKRHSLSHGRAARAMAAAVASVDAEGPKDTTVRI